MRRLLIFCSLTLAVGVAGAQNVSLAWDASPSPDVDGYNIYRSDTSGSGYAKVNSAMIGTLSYVDMSAQEGATYFYVATALRDGLESGFSNELRVDVPYTTAPLPPTNLHNTQQGANNLLEWSPVQHAERYAVDFASDSDTWSMTAVTTATSYEYKAHPNGYPALVGVRALVGGVWSERSVVAR